MQMEMDLGGQMQMEMEMDLACYTRVILVGTVPKALTAGGILILLVPKFSLLEIEHWSNVHSK